MPAEPPPPSATPFNSAVDLRRLSWATPFARDYCHAFERLENFYSGPPSASGSWREAIAARQAADRGGADIAGVLTSQLRAREAPRAALAAAERLAAPGTVAILTGQQAGLFGGPLYTLFKALTAIALARRVESEHGVAAVPVFWVDAEDHDLEEIRVCQVLDDNLELQRIALDLASQAGRPSSAVRLPEAVAGLLDQLRQALPSTEFSAALLERLAAAYAPGAGLVEAFSRWLDCVLGERGLVVFDASDPAAKPLARPVFERELHLRGEVSRLAAAAGAQLSARGYHAQVQPAEDAVALFHLDGGRRPIRLRDGGFALGDAVLAPDALRALVREQPATFSPNVLLRPIVQDTLFPTIAYVTGPHELAYLGQLREVYRRFEIAMPLVYPRLSATILDRGAVRFLARYDLGLDTLQARDDGALNRLVGAQLPAAVEAAVAAAGERIGTELDSIAEGVPAVDPTLVGAVRTTRERMERDLRNLRGKIVQAAKRRDTTLRRQFQRARAQAFPDGAPQERAVSSIYFLNRFGPQVVDRLLDDLPPGVGQHWLLTV